MVPEATPRVQVPRAAAAAWLNTTVAELGRINGVVGARDGHDVRVDDVAVDPEMAMDGTAGDDIVETELMRTRAMRPPTAAPACRRVAQEI